MEKFRAAALWLDGVRGGPNDASDAAGQGTRVLAPRLCDRIDDIPSPV